MFYNAIEVTTIIISVQTDGIKPNFLFDFSNIKFVFFSFFGELFSLLGESGCVWCVFGFVK